MPRVVTVVVVVVVALAVSAGLALFAIVPKYKRLNALGERSALLDHALAEREQLLDTIQAQEDILNEQVNERLLQFLPKTGNLPQLMALLYDIGVREGVGISEIGFEESSALSSPVMASGAVAGLVVSLEINGSYESLRSFFGALEQSIRLIDAENFKLAPHETGVVMQASGKLTTYYRK
ncbi:MAG: type 4a pilus biogenesis protein PilO [bacterium]|nr:type 4a pilus biogenesis protein PilO [bacterium]MDZ4296263.1 type 4a pilus biogenesis protein PilO [Patescibacteria group bacterium]MDZ4296290.1 type 4a pilus biogenesis protein PilO [Patescibacteria group bacterium]